MSQDHTHLRDAEPQRHSHRRAADAFFARWGRRLAYSLLAGLVPASGLMWREREAKIQLLQANTAGLQLVNVRIDNLEKRVDGQHNISVANQEEVKVELRSLREEVRQMYRRAIAAGGMNP